MNNENNNINNGPLPPNNNDGLNGSNLPPNNNHQGPQMNNGQMPPRPTMNHAHQNNISSLSHKGIIVSIVGLALIVGTAVLISFFDMLVLGGIGMTISIAGLVLNIMALKNKSHGIVVAAGILAILGGALLGIIGGIITLVGLNK